jgi:hypothetical protein
VQKNDMMALALAWIVFPLVLAALCLGCGLLVDLLAASSVPGALLLPTGFALMIVIAGFTTMSSMTARLSVPLVVGSAFCGFALSARWRTHRLDSWSVGLAVAAFAVFACPTVLSGQATFEGYITLDDTATWLAITDHVMDHGRNLSGLQPSTYETALNSYLSESGYPVGSFLPLGIGGKLVGQDIAWLFQPAIAYAASMLALSLYWLLTDLVRSARLRAVAAFIATQPALLFGYSTWSGIKEITSAALIALFAAQLALVLHLVTNSARRAAPFMIPLAVTVAAELGAVSAGGMAWLLAALAAAGVLALRVNRRAFLPQAGAFVLEAAIFAIPAIAIAGTFYGHETSTSSLTSQAEIGNLIHPLSRLQVLGIWPSGDFRVEPSTRDLHAAYILMAVLCGAAGFALWCAWRRRSWGLLFYAGTVTVGCILLLRGGSPWLDGKALATASPAALLAGMAGAGLLFERGRRVEALVVSLAIGGGVIWSNVAAYHQVWLAPRQQLAELSSIGQRFGGDGPTLMTEYQPYGARHFLRQMDPEAASELRRRLIPLLNGQGLEQGQYADLDSFQTSAILVYKSLVLRRSPTESRPPAGYQLVWTGRYYEVWQHLGGSSTLIRHLALGDAAQPGGVPRCHTVLAMAQNAARLVAPPRSPVIYADLASATYPAGWGQDGGGAVYPTGAGNVDVDVSIPATRRYSLWLGGSFRDELQVYVDGRKVADERHQLNNAGQYTPVGSVALTEGTHHIRIHYGGPDYSPGSGGVQFGMGPLALSSDSDDGPLLSVSPSNARTLCGRSLDWIESLSG